VTVKGTADGLVVSVDGTPDVFTSLTYHLTDTVATDPGTGEPVPFTPAAATQVGGPTRATVAMLTTLPDGSRLRPEATYYVRVVASNVLGEAPAGSMGLGALDASIVSELVTGKITGGFALLGGMQVGQITIDPDTGITVPHPGGVTHLPADGSAASFAGKIETDDLDVNGGLSINGETNFVNGTLNLANVVTAPTKLPTVSHTWDYTAPIGADTWTLTETTNGTGWASVELVKNQIRTYNKTTGALLASYAAPLTYKLWGVTAVGGSYWAVAASIGMNDIYLLKISASGAKQGEWRVAANATVTGIPTIGTDGTNLMIAWAQTGNVVRVVHYSTAGAKTKDEFFAFTRRTFAASASLSGVGRSPIGRGGAVHTWVVVDGVLYMLDDSTRDWAYYFGRPEGVKGILWTSDAKFRWLGWDTYRVYEYPIAWWDAPVMITYSWYDSDPTGGTHETQAGPMVYFTPWHFSLLHVQTPPPADSGMPDDPDSVRVYLNNHLQPALPAGKTEAKYARVTASGVAPKTTNEFLSATTFPGEVRSDRTDGKGPLVYLRGDGVARIGGLEVLANGTTTLNGDTGWVGVTSFGSGWENYGGAYAPVAYRKIGNVVHLRGLVRNGPHATPIFTLPTGFRPPFPGIFPAIFHSVTRTFESGLPKNGTADHRHDVTVLLHDVAGRVHVDTNGDVIATNVVFDTRFVSLDGISFLID